MSNTIKAGGVLFAICLVASLALGIVNDMTFEQIEAMKYDTSVYVEMLPAEKYSLTEEKEDIKTGVTHIFEGTNGEELVGYVFSVSVVGYGGDMILAVAIDKDGVTQGYRITDDSETQSLGGKAKVPEFIAQFVGTQGALKSVKQEPSSDNEIQAITGATVTTEAIISGVNLAIDEFGKL